MADDLQRKKMTKY